MELDTGDSAADNAPEFSREFGGFFDVQEQAREESSPLTEDQQDLFADF
jgi:hypothetical protein